ncbi:HNH endonuclease signature motif containing protein [Streptomyces sp. NPDC057382]|uniref:HNH endonuclease signature motif containing protein n=1 Tax=unclassified Streptomyces TaxID=2593676 RepID=UPI00362E7CBA
MADLVMPAGQPATPTCADCGLHWPGQRFARGRCRTCYGRLIRKLKAEGTFAPVETSRPIGDRLFEKTTPGHGGCVIFTGHLNNNGYGTIGEGGKHGRSLYAHRVAYELLVGPIPAGLVLDHRCSTPRCINPRHLEPVTQEENVRRAAEKRTHCAQGHEFTPENTRHRPGRGRECRACARKYRESRSTDQSQADEALRRARQMGGAR